MGRIKLDLEKMSILAACIKKIKFPNRTSEDISDIYPTWIMKEYSKDILSELVKESLLLMAP